MKLMNTHLQTKRLASWKIDWAVLQQQQQDDLFQQDLYQSPHTRATGRYFGTLNATEKREPNQFLML